MKIFKNNDGEPYRLYNYQLPIVETLFFKKHRRTTCKATTRAGKSEAVAIACILIATILKNEKILIIAPTTEHAKIIMNYVAKHIIDSKDIIERLDIDLQGKKAEKIKSEISKKKLTFKTGSSIEIKSATISHGGRGLIGEGGSIIIIDEVALIPEEIYRTAILRMLGDSPNSILFEIGNSIARNHFQDHHNNPEWHKISISHEDCIAEGRLTKEFVESQRRELLPIEFRMWYEAEFPEEAEDSVFKEKWINQAVKLYEDNMNLEVNIDNEMHMGCDIARYGVDLSVHTNIEKTMDFWIVRNILATGERSTMATVGDIIELDRKFHTKMIKIDEGRYGGSLIDRLREDDVGIGHKIMEVQFGSLPMRDKKKNS